MIDETSRDAARRAIARNSPGLEISNPKRYAAFVNALAGLHAEWEIAERSHNRVCGVEDWVHFSVGNHTELALDSLAVEAGHRRL